MAGVKTSAVGLAWSCASLVAAADKALVVVLLPRPAYKHKQIGLLVRPRKITFGYGRK